MQQRKLTIWPFVAVAMLVCTVQESFGQDTILLKRKQGRSSNLLGQITATTKDQLTVVAGTAKRTVDVNDLRRVSFGGEPGELKSARQAIANQQYEQALESLERIRPDARDSDLIIAEIEFYKAYAQGKLAVQGAADPKAAVKSLLSFIKTHPNSFHYYEAVELLGDLAITLGKFDIAARYYGDYAKAPFPEYQLRGGILKADAMRAIERYDEAAKQYADVLKLPAAGPEATRLKTLAEIGLAACQAAQGEIDQSIKSLEQIIKTNDPDDGEIMAPAYNALGFAYYKAGKPIDATLAYLHVDVLYFNQRNQHAEALHYLTKLWNELNQPNRAVEARQILAQRYAGTLWAKKS